MKFTNFKISLVEYCNYLNNGSLGQYLVSFQILADADVDSVPCKAFHPER